MGTERQLKVMANDWKKETYTIQVHLHDQIISQEVAGVVNGGFGIHETGGAWNITHLATGWNCFSAADENGAKILAQYLIANYLPEFERLRISGTTVENYCPLENKITSDGELAHLKKLFADASSEAEKRENRMKVQIIS